MAMSQAATVLRRTMSRAIDEAGARLAACGVASARLDAEVLMAAAAGVSRAEILASCEDPSTEALKNFDAMLARRERREPVAYIVGRKEFYSLDFEVTPAVLIPRPETEMVVSATLEAIAGIAAPRVLDIGTGSGAIAIAIAVNSPAARVVATDVSSDALTVARRNAAAHHVEDRVTLRLADCFDVRDGNSRLGRFDLVVSNPPYIDEAALAGLMPDVRDYEPRVALSAGADGLDFYRRIAAGARAHLQATGEVIVEVGAAQAHDVIEIFQDAALEVRSVINDLAGHHRIVRAALG